MRVADSSVNRRPRLDALSGVRIIAALHIYFFHLKQAHDAGLMTFDLIAAMPAPLARLIGRGYISTGFFFALSGFLLAYAYLDRDGRPKASDLGFWRGRFVRLYPLYFLSLILLMPAPALLPITTKPTSPGETLGMVATNLALIQAWFPRFAIAWNAPAWALSAFAAFYVAFPPFARLISRWDRRALLALALALAFASWLPALAYFAFDPYGDAWTVRSITLSGPWLSALRFNPLSWLPQFLAGVTLGRFFASQVDDDCNVVASRPGVSLGDLAALATLLLVAFVSNIPYVALRHGLLTPVFLVILYDLARGRGVLARALCWSPLRRASEASFGLFALQMPVGVWFMIATTSSSHGTTLHLLAMIATTLAASIAWSELVQRRLTASRRRGQDGRGNLPAAPVSTLATTDAA